MHDHILLVSQNDFSPLKKHLLLIFMPDLFPFRRTSDLLLPPIYSMEEPQYILKTLK